MGIQKDKDGDKLHQFLMGLNEVYLGVRSNLLMMQPPPSLDNAYNILLQDENQIQNHFTPQLIPKSAFFSANMNNKSFPLKQYNQKIGFDQSRGAMCFVSLVRNQNFKLNKGKRVATNVSTEIGCPYPGQKSASPQISHVIAAQTQISSDSGSQSNLMAFANFAGCVLSLPVYFDNDSHACLLSGTSRSVWIIDSGATDHMTSNKDIFFNLIPLTTSYLVTLPNGYKAKDLSMRKLLELSKLDQGLYKLLHEHQSTPGSNFSISVFNKNVLPMNVSDVSLNKVVQNKSALNSIPLVSSNDMHNINKHDVVWHHMLGHIPFAKMKLIPSISFNLSSKQSFPFGCLCYATIPKSNIDKLDPRAAPCVLVGYPFGKKGYKLYNLSTRGIFVSRDIAFHESIFPFLLSSPSPSSLVPSIPADDYYPFQSKTSSFPCSVPSSSVASSDPPVIPSIPVPSDSYYVPPPEFRRSSMTHTLLSHLNDFITQLLPSLSSSTSTSLSAAHTSATEPYFYTQAATSPARQGVMRKEFEALETNKTWAIIELPKGKKSIGCK
ncbi:uncharacterized protein [Nicotiana tomentosiformis]|uniref:uncharacterized protein n=1 Tax=Nicotiana tomentosiformis TaxID=4098 RepID=UPI00388CD55F